MINTIFVHVVLLYLYTNAYIFQKPLTTMTANSEALSN